MASPPKYKDRVQHTTTTTGTGTLTLGGAVTGFQSFAAGDDGLSYYYCVQDVDATGNPSGDWEVGLGTYTHSGTTFSRDTVLASSNGGSAVNFGAGTKRVFVTVPAKEAIPTVPSIYGGMLKGARSVYVAGDTLGAGTHDLYTVPAGRRAVVVGSPVYEASGSTGTGATMTPKVKIASTYYLLSESVGVQFSPGNFSAGVGQILEAGETLAVAVSVGNLNCAYQVVECDDTSSIKAIVAVNLSTGNNTVYTCPAGKSVVSVCTSANAVMGVSPVAGRGIISNESGGTRTVAFATVENGGSMGSSKRRSPNVSAVDNTVSNWLPWFSLTPGDALVLMVDTGHASLMVRLPVMEW